MDDHTGDGCTVAPPPQGTPPPSPAAQPVKAPSPFPPPKAQAPVPPAPVPGLPPLPDGTDPALTTSTGAPAQPQAPQPQADLSKYDITLSEDYFKSLGFQHDIWDFASHASSCTGYRQLDKVQPLYPGLYVIGAISSLGKTTFASQMADQVAASGRPVIYFSIEQDKFELLSKSIARGFFRTDQIKSGNFTNGNDHGGDPGGWPIPSSISIRRGFASCFYPNEFQAEIDEYVSAVGNRIAIVNGTFSLTVEEIAYIAKDFTMKCGCPPLVVIDYLQVIKPTLVNGRIPDAKTSVDHIIQSLKILQKDLGVPMIVVSSLNRQNYMTPIDFESFKESGGIEYTADVIWGLQLQLLNSTEFYFAADKNGKHSVPTSLKQKRDLINEAKRATPRKIQFVCLKNRFGVANYKANFLYFPASDFFMEPIDANLQQTWLFDLRDVPHMYDDSVRTALPPATLAKVQAAAKTNNKPPRPAVPIILPEARIVTARIPEDDIAADIPENRITEALAKEDAAADATDQPENP